MTAVRKAQVVFASRSITASEPVHHLSTCSTVQRGQQVLSGVARQTAVIFMITVDRRRAISGVFTAPMTRLYLLYPAEKGDFASSPQLGVGKRGIDFLDTGNCSLSEPVPTLERGVSRQRERLRGGIRTDHLKHYLSMT